MKKKVVYQITKHKFAFVEVETEEQEKIIKELNRDFEREDKRSKTAHIRCVSIETMQEEGVELKSRSPSIEEVFISNEERVCKYEIVHSVLKLLTDRQRQVLIMRFWKNKTFREIASFLGIHFTTVAESYHSALKKIKKFLKNTPTII